MRAKISTRRERDINLLASVVDSLSRPPSGLIHTAHDCSMTMAVEGKQDLKQWVACGWTPSSLPCRHLLISTGTMSAFMMEGERERERERERESERASERERERERARERERDDTKSRFLSQWHISKSWTSPQPLERAARTSDSC